MVNDLTAIMPKILTRALIGLREMATMPRIVNSSYGDDAQEKGAVINIPIPTAQVASNVLPGATPPDPSATATKTVPIGLVNWMKSNFGLTDQDMTNIDSQASFLPMETLESVRSLANAVNLQLLSQYKGGGPANPGIFGFVGTPGLTPMQTSDQEVIDTRKVLARQLCPKDNRRMLLDFDAEANALGLPSFKDISQSADPNVKIEGMVGRKYGFDFYSDDFVPTHIAGTAAGFLSNIPNGVPIGATAFPVDTGTGTFVLGDVLTFAGQLQTYVVTAFDGINLQFYPALKAPVVDNTVIASKATHVVNMGFHRDAFAFANRPLDSAQAIQAGAKILSMSDPLTGIAMRLELIREYKQVMWEFDILWGGAMIRPEFASRLAG